MSENAKLTRGSITGHLVGQTLPMIIGVGAMMSIGLVDSYFIGQLGGAQLAAISFIYPVTGALASLGVGVMVGVNSVVARALGQGDQERAERRANFGIAFATVVGLVLAGALLLANDTLFRLMQVTPDLMPYIRAYMIPFALGFPLSLMLMGFNGVLRGQGEARRTSVISITYASANWVLDPLLIAGHFGFPQLGVAGAAWASVAGWALACVMSVWLLKSTSLPFQPSQIMQCDMRATLAPIVRVAGPAALSNAINPVGLSVLTALMASQGQAAVAAFGAGGRVQSFAVVPLLGLSGAIGAIVGQNWGAGLHDRSRRAMQEAGWFCVFYGLGMALLLSFAGEWFGGLFSNDPQLVRSIATYLGISAWGYAGYGLLITANGALNAIGKASASLVQSVARVFLVMVPLAFVLRPLWGEEGIFYAELAANILGGVIAVLVTARLLRKQTDHAASGI
ncbi:MAG: MATE family efflux transporter [Sphingomonadaceae bacterium]